MAVNIGPKIGIDGEREFRNQIETINQELKTLGSEMKKVVSSFDDSSDAEERASEQTRILNSQLDAQERKLKKLQEGLEKSADKYGKADKKTLKWQQAVNEATADLNNMKKQLDNVGNELDDFGSAATKSSGLLDKFGSTLVKGFAAGAVVSGIKELGSAMMGLVSDTQEYRTIMASLESSSQRAGYSAEQTAETYKQLYGVLGDNQTAATATANLQALGLSQDKLTELTNAAIGAWATYGDSIPIDGLSEAINETVKAGQVTGTFADVLNWAGTSEDAFNEKLAAANSETERANIVMQELARQGLAEAGEAWRQNNQDIVAVNEAQSEFDEAMGRLGTILAPAAAGLINFAADGLGVVVDALKSAVGWVKDLIGWFQKLSNYKRTYKIDLPNVDESQLADGSHAGGLGYVPFDGYMAKLHKGEMVLTSAQADAMRRPFANGLNNLATGMVNGMQTAVAGIGGGSYSFNLVLPDGSVLARYQLPHLIQVANDSGTPILNPM